MTDALPVLDTEARDRALVLDYLAHGNPGESHPAWGMKWPAKAAAHRVLQAQGYIEDAPHLGLGRVVITPAGLAAHRATQPADAQG